MAEKIVIAELDIQTDDLRARIDELRKSSIDYSIKIKDLKKATDNLSTATDEEVSSYNRLIIEQKKVNNEMNQNIKVVHHSEIAQNKLSHANRKEAQSISELKAENKALITLRNQIPTTTEAGIKKIKELNAQIENNSNKIRTNTDAEEQRIMNIGNYKSALDGVLQKTNIYGVNLGAIAQQSKSTGQGIMSLTRSMVSSESATNGSVKGLKAFRIALISTGIGAIVVALGGLISAFASTQRGADAISRALKPISVIFQRLLGLAQNIATDFVDYFGEKGIKGLFIDLGDVIVSNVTNRIKSIGLFGKAIAKIFSGEVSEGFKDLGNAALQGLTGVEDVIGKSENLAKETKKLFKESVNDANRLSDLTIAIENAEISLAKNRSRLMKQAKEQKQISEDTKKTEQDRLTALDQANKFNEQLLKEELSLIDLKLKKANIEASFNDTDRQAKLEIARLEGERSQKELSSIEMATTLQNQRNTIIKQVATKNIKNLTAELELYKLQNEQLKNTNITTAEIYQNRIDLIKNQYDMEKDILNQKLKDDLVDEQEYKLQLQQIENTYTDSKKNLDLEYQEFKENINTKEQQDKIEQIEKEYEQKRLKADSEKQRLILDLEEKKAIELTNAELTEQEKALIEAKYEKQKSEIDTKLTNKKLDNAGQVASKIKQFAGEETAIGKAAAIAQAGINIAQGITKALASKGLIGIIEGALIAGAGAKQIASIKATKTKFASGGLVETGGKLHSNGGTKYYGEDGNVVELEKGELWGVMSRKASEKFLEFNNMYTNGSSSMRKFATGGIITPRTAGIQQDIGSIISEAFNTTKIVVPVRDINQVNNNIAVAQREANI